MPSATPTYALPYPLPADPADVPADIQALAAQLDGTTLPRFADLTVAGTQTFAGTVGSSGTFVSNRPDVNAWSFQTIIASMGASTAWGVFGATLHWGPGNAGTDVQLYRQGTGYLGLTNAALRTNNVLVTGGASGGSLRVVGGANNVSVGVYMTQNDTNPAVFFCNTGSAVDFRMAPGNVAYDTRMARSAANTFDFFASAWHTLKAAAFAVQSDRAHKSTVRKIDAEEDRQLVEGMLAANVWTFKRKGAGADRHLGLMADELPEHVVLHSSFREPDAKEGDEGEPMDFVDLYKLCAALLATVQSLDARMTTLEVQPA